MMGVLRETTIMPDDLSADPKTAPTTPTHDTIKLWRKGPPRTIGGVGPEATFRPPHGLAANTTMLRNVSDPTLTVYRPAPGTANGCGVIVCPGGGWGVFGWEAQGDDGGGGF